MQIDLLDRKCGVLSFRVWVGAFNFHSLILSKTLSVADNKSLNKTFWGEGTR